MDINGKTVIITGASRGIGKQIAIDLGRRGANVVVAARTVQPHRRLTGTINETVEAVRLRAGRRSPCAPTSENCLTSSP